MSTFLRVAKDKKGRLKALTHTFVAGGVRVRVTAKAPVECNDPAVLEAARSDPGVEVVTAAQLVAEAEAEAEAAGGGAVAALKAALQSTIAAPAVVAVPVAHSPDDVGYEPAAYADTDDVDYVDVANTKVVDVLDWVGFDPVRAQAALDAEVSVKGSDGARPSLVAALTRIVEGRDGG